MVHQATLLVVLTLTATCLPSAAGQEDTASSVRARIIGTWELVSTTEYMADGSKRPYPDVGPNGKGFLIYTADGHMCAAGMNPDRPAWKDVNHPTDAEKLRAMDSFFGYCGRYEIDIATHTIYHYPEVALEPGFVGSKQKRPYKFEGEILTFSDKDTTPGVERYAISWKKVKPI
jgi:hypothetical protein